MASTILPLYDDPYYSYSINLDNEAFGFTFRWNSRAGQWMMSIEDADDNMIIRNVPLVPAYPLLQQFSLEKPIGEIYLLPVEQEKVYQPIPDPRRVFASHFLVYDNFLEDE